MTFHLQNGGAALFGVLYLLSGCLMIASAGVPALAGMTAPYLIPADPAGGFVLCVVGAVFLFAWRELARGVAEGPAFLYTGMALSGIFGLVALLSCGAQGLQVLLFPDGEETWTWLRLVVPMLYLALVPTAGLLTWGRAFLNDLVGA